MLRVDLERVFLGGCEDLREVDGLNVRAAARERTTDVHEAGAVAAGAHGCTGCFNVVCLVVDHCAGDVSVLEGEGTAEAAALVHALDLGVLDALNGADQVLLAGAQAEHTHTVAGAVVGDVLGEVGTELLSSVGDAEDVNQQLGELEGAGSDLLCLQSRRGYVRPLPAGDAGMQRRSRRGLQQRPSPRSRKLQRGS